MPETWNQRKFDAALLECVRASSRTAAAVINGHALRIAFGAQKFTPKADAGKIGLELSEMTEYFERQKSGRTVKRKIMAINAPGAPLVALLVNKQRGRQRKKGLYGPEMAEAVRKFISGRKRTVAFLKSGWLPAIKLLAQIVPSRYRGGGISVDYSVKQYGAAKGRVTPAVESDSPTAIIENLVGVSGSQSEHHNAALMKYGRPALEAAFRLETVSMMDHLKTKLDAESFAAFNLKNR